MEAEMSSKKQPRDQVSARLDPEVLEVVQRIAEAERRPISNLVRNVLEDWAKGRELERREHAA
jgi:predicted transcriptional regulator